MYILIDTHHTYILRTVHTIHTLDTSVEYLHTQKLETYPYISAHSLFTDVAEVSPHGNFERGEVGIEESNGWLLSTVRGACYSVLSVTITPYPYLYIVAFSSSTRWLMDDWDLTFSELFLFHRRENRG